MGKLNSVEITKIRSICFFRRVVSTCCQCERDLLMQKADGHLDPTYARFTRQCSSLTANNIYLSMARPILLCLDLYT